MSCNDSNCWHGSMRCFFPMASTGCIVLADKATCVTRRPRAGLRFRNQFPRTRTWAVELHAETPRNHVAIGSLWTTASLQRLEK